MFSLNILYIRLEGGVLQQSHADALNRDQQNNYMILLQQREEENRQEIAKLTAEIKALKVQLLQHRSKFCALRAQCSTLRLFRQTK